MKTPKGWTNDSGQVSTVRVLSNDTRLFLCHSHRDKPFVRRLARDLRELSTGVWLDELELSPGDSLHDRIGRALEESGFVGVVLSPDSIKSRWCQSELQQALAKEKRTGKTIVLPLLYRRVQPPPFLEDRLYLGFSRSYWSAVVKLVAFLHGVSAEIISDGLAQNRPKGMTDAKALLRQSGWDNRRYVPKVSYERLAEILERSGVPIDDRFVISAKGKKTTIIC